MSGLLSSTAGELIARFVIGGVIVSLFAVIAEVCRPRWNSPGQVTTGVPTAKASSEVL